MKDFLLLSLAVVAIGSISYGGYWIAKTVSYSLFYEDMVLESIKETVKASCMK
jgi:hypothetical protein